MSESFSNFRQQDMVPQQQQQSYQPNNRRSLDISSKRRIPREVRFGNYVLGSTLGEGEFGKVKLGWRKDGKNPSQAAIKLIKRDSIPTGSEKEGKIYREITALKKLRHPNIVRLVEVLQNDKYIGIVLEYASGGELFDYILDHRYLKESLACRLFAQLVSGVDYMHAKGIVHRDLKLENLLLDKHKNIIITDFGFVNSFHNANNDLMKTSCGSPCYAAPELVVSSEPYEGKKVDIWSCGVILYAMLAGYLPFDDDPENPDGSNIARLYHYITTTPLTFPEYIQPTPRDLLRRILVSNPNKRISLKDIRSHQWLAPHAPFLSVTPMEWDRNYRSSKVLTQQDKINRRMSLMENPTSASLMLNKQNARSYSTHNVQAALYSNPAAPQTSRTVAIPSAEGSPVTSPVRQAKTPASSNQQNSYSTVNLTNTDSSTGNHSNGSSVNTNSSNMTQGTPVTRHSRSESTASLALQAVVDADFEIKRRYSNGSDIVTTTPVRNSTQRPISFAPILSDNKNFETIKESPEHQKMLPPPVPVFKNPANSNMKLPSSRTSKPRPTSYHPSYTPSNDLSFIASTNFSENSLKVGNGRPKVSNNSAFSSTSESLMSTSIKEYSPGSIGQTNTEPEYTDNIDETIDDKIDNSDESSDKSTKHKIDSVMSEKHTRRNSFAMDLLTNAMDTLSMISKVTTAQPVNPHDSVNDVTNKTEIYNEKSKENLTINEGKSMGNSNMNNSKLSEIDESEKENVGIPKAVVTKPRSNQILSNSNLIAAGTSASIPSASTPTEPKYKRFSLLTFYQSVPGPTAPGNYVVNNVESIAEDTITNINVKNNSQTSSEDISPKSTTIPANTATSITNSYKATSPLPDTQNESSSTIVVNASTNTTAPKQRKVSSNNANQSSNNIYPKPKTVRKPLEPSNVKTERRVSGIYGHDKPDKVERETSTARKVMDFFKRRSMRI